MVKLPPYRQLQDLPGVGPAAIDDLKRLNITTLEEVAGSDPIELYSRIVELDGPTDRCVLYVFRCAKYAASTPNPNTRLLDWWAWKD